jgi:hypothetical protein
MRGVRRDVEIWVLRLLIGLCDHSIAFYRQSEIKKVNRSLELEAFPLEDAKVIEHEHQSLPLQVTFSEPDKKDFIYKPCIEQDSCKKVLESEEKFALLIKTKVQIC